MSPQTGVPQRPLVTIPRVRKRDGRDVPYDRRKIRAAVTAALQAADCADAEFAAEIAEVVELALMRRGEGKAQRAGTSLGQGVALELVPHIEDIQDLVETALMDLGQPDAAKAFILHRDRRARIRAALQMDAERSSESASSGRVRVGDDTGAGPWSKGRIVAALMEEAGMPRETADEVASRVEHRVFDSGLRRLSTGLLRELVDNELVALGLDGAVRHQGPVGIPRHDLRLLLSGQTPRPWRPSVSGSGVGDEVSAEILRRYALEDVLGVGVADMHRSGDLHVEDLDSPHLPLSFVLPGELLAGGTGPGRAFEALESIASSLRSCSRGVVIENPAELLAATGSRRQANPGPWLAALAAVSRAAGRRVLLGDPGPRRSRLTAALVEELDRVGDGPHATGILLGPESLSQLLRGDDGTGDTGMAAPAAERLLDAGRLHLVWSDGVSRFGGPGCPRHMGERRVLTCAGAVALNLPRLVHRVGPWHEDGLLGGLAELVGAAVEACSALDAFQRARPMGRSRGGASASAAARSYALVPVGLREALRIFGDGRIDLDLCARVLGLLDDAGRRFSREAGISLSISPFFGKRAAERFAHIATREGGGGQSWLFAAPGTGDGGNRRDASQGFSLSPTPGVHRGEAEALGLATLTRGALGRTARVPGAGSRTDSLSGLHTLDAFARLRAAGFGTNASADGPTSLFTRESGATSEASQSPDLTCSPDPAPESPTCD